MQGSLGPVGYRDWQKALGISLEAGVRKNPFAVQKNEETVVSNKVRAKRIPDLLRVISPNRFAEGSLEDYLIFSWGGVRPAERRADINAGTADPKETSVGEVESLLVMSVPFAGRCFLLGRDRLFFPSSFFDGWNVELEVGKGWFTNHLFGP